MKKSSVQRSQYMTLPSVWDTSAFKVLFLGSYFKKMNTTYLMSYIFFERNSLLMKKEQVYTLHFQYSMLHN